MNCCNIPPLLDPIECRDIRPVRVTIDFLLHVIRMTSKDMPRKKKKAYRKQEIKALATYVDKQMHAGDI